MIEGKTVLVVIPARGGSKGVPKKNIRKIAGKPLIAWTVEEAKKSRFIDRMILSSDDHEIISVAKQWRLEVPFVRPMELAQDETPAEAVILHVIENIPGYHYVVLLQVTSPLRTVDDIDGCIEKCASRAAKACISVTESTKSPYWMYKLDEKDFMHPLIKSEFLTKRRQDQPKVFLPNGAVYIAETDFFQSNKDFISQSTIAYQMPQERSLDIDTELDFIMLEVVVKWREESNGKV